MKYGILNLFKPVGPTSRDCVNKLLKPLWPSKVAHAGTLDPLAQGVLLILVGPAVRLMDEIHELDKEYVATFALGQRSPSGDLETECESVPLSSAIGRDAIQDVLGRFRGWIDQVPPAFSAIRVDGKRAHKAARRGTEVQMPARRIAIHDLELLDCNLPVIRLRIRCSTGTYIRTLGRDVAKSLGTDAVMTELTRVRVGPFGVGTARSLESICEVGAADRFVEPATVALSHWERWIVDDFVMRRILDGQRLPTEEVLSTTASRLAVLDMKNILRAILKKLPDNTWRCEKGIAHWNVFP